MKQQPADPDSRSLASSTRDAHRDCMRIVSEIEACIDRRPDDAGWLSCLQTKLPQLVVMLRDHFRDEQAEELFTDLPTKHPRFADRLDRLAAEHPKILEVATRLSERAGQLDGAPAHELREFDGRLQLLVAGIRRHEAEENEIVLAALWEDVGGGD